MSEDLAKQFLAFQGFTKLDNFNFDLVAALMVKYKAAPCGGSPLADGEPVFTLRAQDAMAPAMVQMWITLNPQVSEDKIRDAKEILEAMKKWPHRRMAT